MIEQKLQILRESNVIDDQAVDFANKVIELLSNKGYISEKDQCDAFITHLVMATSRQKTAEEISPIDDEMLSQLKAENCFNEAKKLWEHIEEISPVTFRENEFGYFYLHLCTLLTNQ